MYSKIVLCLMEEEDEVLEKQVGMLKERHHADVERISPNQAPSYIADCAESILFISDDVALRDKARDRGIATNDPKKMKESYTKAMEMLKQLGSNGKS